MVQYTPYTDSAYGDEGTWAPAPEFEGLIKKLGFTLNPKKTRVSSNWQRQEVTGLTVNKSPDIPRNYYRNTRAMYHSLFTTGEYSENVRSARKMPEPIKQIDNLNILDGRLRYIFYTKLAIAYQRSLTAKKEESQENQKKNLNQRQQNEGYYRLYKDFLFYKTFIATEKPLLICEGSTDVSHIKGALSFYENEFPRLIGKKRIKHITGGKEVEKEVSDYLVKIISLFKGKYNPLFRTDGSSASAEIATIYKSKLQKLLTLAQTPPKSKPIIILLDHDDGLNERWKKLLIESREKVGTYPPVKKDWDKFLNEEFPSHTPDDCYSFLITHNLHVIILPKGKDIEGLYPDSRTKDFRDEQNKISTEQKKTFAEHMRFSQTHRTENNFKKFRPLLDLIQKIISAPNIKT